MLRSEFIKIVPTIKNGTYVRITVKKSLDKDLKAAHRGVNIEKQQTVVVRLGVRYSHIASVAQSILASGLNSTEIDLKLPWGEWDKDCQYLISHKENYYLRCTMAKIPNYKPKAQYYLEGKEISVHELQALGYLRDSYWNKPEPSDVFNYNLADVVSIG